MFAFKQNYFALTLLLFAVEVIIALFVHDQIIRPYVGDVLVVMLIYCFLKSFLNFRVLPIAVFVLLFAFGIETLQYFDFVTVIGLQDSNLARTVLANSFVWIDIYAYIGGIALVMITEKFVLKNP